MSSFVGYMSAERSPHEARASSTQEGSKFPRGNRTFTVTACFVSSGRPETSGIHFPCQAVFCVAATAISEPEYNHPIIAAQILVMGDQMVACTLEYVGHVASLVMAYFKTDNAVFFKMARGT